MPVHEGTDSAGKYFQWGHHGHRYYYSSHNAKSREEAKQKATAQGRAAYAHGYRGK